MRNIPNPYLEKGLKSDQLVRIQADVAYEDRNLIRTICPEQGCYNFALANLLIKLCDELRKNNIVDCSREDDFRNAIVNCRIELGNGLGTGQGPRLHHGASGGSMPQTSAPNVGGGVEAVRAGDTVATNEPSRVQGESREGGNEGRKDKGSKRVKRVRDVSAKE